MSTRIYRLVEKSIELDNILETVSACMLYILLEYIM